MIPAETGRRYDAIAAWWDAQMRGSTIGLPYVRRALALCAVKGAALDVGCGSGRLVGVLEDAGLRVVGLDVSAAMLEMARARHPRASFVQADIAEWAPVDSYDVIVAWDSTFHLPHAAQRPVVEKLCDALAPGGALLFTAGGIDGEISGQMQGLTFDYGSLVETDYVSAMTARGCRCVLMERDQHPLHHVVFVAART